MKEHEHPYWKKAKTVWTDWKEDPPKGKHVYPANVDSGSDITAYHVSKHPLEKHHLKKLDEREKKSMNEYLNGE